MPSSQAISKIAFHYLKNDFRFADRSDLKAFLLDLFKKEHKKLESLQYIFCSDNYLLRVNKQFLGHDYFTDIISFNLSKFGQPIQAEVYISIDRVRDNAKIFEISFKKELHRVIFHGALHLCGYKDKKEPDIKTMRKIEDKYLGLYLH